MRRTGISVSKVDGAIEDILKWASHAPPKSVMGLSTSVEWETLSRKILKLSLKQRTKLDDVALEFEQFRCVNATKVPGKK